MIELKSFVAETLKQIVEGVSEAAKAVEPLGATVNAVGLQALDKNGLQNRHDGSMPQVVEFDVAVTTSEATSTKGGVGIFVGPVGLGSKGESDATSSTASRIRFSVPVSLPQGTNEKIEANRNRA